MGAAYNKHQCVRQFLDESGEYKGRKSWRKREKIPTLYLVNVLYELEPKKSVVLRISSLGA